MNCSSCEVNKISPEIQPFGGYFCCNEHLQCIECNTLSKGFCRVCGSAAKFVQMNYNSYNGCEVSTDLKNKSNKSCNVFSKEIFQEIETQSRLSKEHLSIINSRESLVAEAENNSDKNKKEMEILFVGGSGAENPVSLIDQDKNNADIPKVKKENIFLFANDTNNVNNRNISEIRFIDSSDSLHNFMSSAKHNKNDINTCSRSQQLNKLSVEALRDFEPQNASITRETVKEYLDNYKPTALSNFPSYNCIHSVCDFKYFENGKKLEMKTVSVSTESEPSLKSTCLDNEKKIISGKFKSADYLIMQAMGVATAGQSVNLVMDKDDKSSVDMRMQNILKTLKEDPLLTKFTEKPNLTKIPTNVSTKQLLVNIHNDKKHENYDQNEILLKQLLNTHRAFNRSPKSSIVSVKNVHLLCKSQPVHQEPPLPQFQTVPCSTILAAELLQNRTKYLTLKPVPAYMLNIPRLPVLCPESTCRRMIFVSDFNKHFVVDHSHLPMERITPFQCKNFFLDARLAHDGTSKCHLLYLMCNKITNLGSSEYKDFLPILVMTTRISLNEICGLREKTSSLYFFLIWVTGIVPEEFPISVSITVWSRCDKIPSCHVVYSGQLYSIRNSQRGFDVWQSGRMLLLSDLEIDSLTCGGREMLNVQLSVH